MTPTRIGIPLFFLFPCHKDVNFNKSKIYHLRKMSQGSSSNGHNDLMRTSLLF